MVRSWFLWAIAVAFLAPPVGAEPDAAVQPAPSAAQEFFEFLKAGTVKANLRARWENARIDDAKVANALTLRTRLGYGTKAWHGLSAYAEFENIASADGSLYYNGVGTNTRGRTLVADPGTTELNQAYGDFAFTTLGSFDLHETKTKLRAGRQRMIYDDARFIGNVGWRQNEQTYDAVEGSTSLGLAGFQASYAYLWEVHRIFGDEGARGASTRDYGADSHLVNLHYSGLEALKVTLFGYFLDFQNSPSASAPANSSRSYGFRGNGALALGEDLELVYSGSYAYQESATNNPVDYAAHYGAVDVALARAEWGSLGGGYEVLGSDDRMGNFRTPLATAHKFNGWADTFLDNGGAFGLRDAYLYVAPKLPFELQGKIVFHQSWSDSGGTKRGTELDALISRKVFKYVTLLSKFAWYKGQNLNRLDGGRADRYRFWLEATFAF